MKPLTAEMAYHGNWQALFNFLSEEIKKQASIRDYLNGEKMIQGFLLAYINITNYFLTWSEREMGGGFSDLYLEPFLARYPDMKYGYLIELKYISEKQLNKEKLNNTIKIAKTQLQNYSNDKRLAQIKTNTTLKKLILIYNKWELVYQESVD